MRVVYNYGAGPDFTRRLESLGERGLDVAVCPEEDDARLFELLGQAEVLWHCLRPVTAEVMDAAPNLALVQKIGVGVNTIDLEHARKRGIAVCNMPGTNSRAVAEHTLALMLAVLRQIARFDGDVRRGEGWRWPAARQDTLGEIAGRTIGLIGFGGVPALLAPMLEAMGARVIYTATAPKPGRERGFRTLDALLAESDVVSLHVPLTGDTHALLDADRLAALAPGTVLINTARGALIDETALLAALDDGRVAGCGLDVLAEEPAPAEHALFGYPNVVITPHIAWLTRETLERSLTVAVDNCERLAKGRPLRNRIV